MAVFRRYCIANAVAWPLIYVYILNDEFQNGARLSGFPEWGELVIAGVGLPLVNLLLVGLPTLLFMAAIGKGVMQTDNVWCWRLLVLAAIGWLPWFVMTKFESPMSLGYGSLLTQVLFALLMPAMSRAPVPSRPRQRGPVA